MKALIIIAACLALAVIFKGVEYFTSNSIRSVGAKANRNARNIAKVDINDDKALKEALDYYKDLAD